VQFSEKAGEDTDFEAPIGGNGCARPTKYNTKMGVRVSEAEQRRSVQRGFVAGRDADVPRGTSPARSGSRVEPGFHEGNLHKVIIKPAPV
jgi:hypothetical protein